MKKYAAIMFAAATVFAAPAFAQDGTATLRVDSGTVMTSNGGEYQSANTGRPLAAGDKVMVNAGGSATLVYGNGCTMKLEQAGVYTVPATCSAATWTSSTSNGMSAFIIAGAALLGAAAVENAGDNTPPGPLSTGVVHF